ncbi:hypothetical protein EV294_11280 [Paenibacillus sp. BK033]|uniref:hypothetical protein n=1 Tax=Paenibacillus sp. BK033 TaxID=2512133 RepID=UPI0010D5BF1E|nr:hypothetical protein [Paenibacillus sp. BK033]TCM89615.1 hypothetical protein EV294_11280 [Paenibacillus sp. BK033]
MYGIKPIDAEGNEYLLRNEEDTAYENFATFEDADDFNYEFEDTLEEGLRSEVTEIN